MADGIHTLDYIQTYKNCNLKMSYKEIPNILDYGVSLLNKPLSNLEIIHAAKKQSNNYK